MKRASYRCLPSRPTAFAVTLGNCLLIRISQPLRSRNSISPISSSIFTRYPSKHLSNFSTMVVVRFPSENRSAMAKPAPTKLDPQVANKVKEERKKEWSSKCSPRSISLDKNHYLSIGRLTGIEAIFSISSVRKFGQRWRSKVGQK
jgi:hypothetical protein